MKPAGFGSLLVLAMALVACTGSLRHQEGVDAGFHAGLSADGSVSAGSGSGGASSAKGGAGAARSNAGGNSAGAGRGGSNNAASGGSGTSASGNGGNGGGSGHGASGTGGGSGTGASGTGGGSGTGASGTGGSSGTGASGTGGSSGTGASGTGGGAGTSGGSGGSTPPPPLGVLRVDPVNPRYFSDGTKVVFLTGSHTWGNLKDRGLTDPPPAFDYTAFLDFLAAHNHNFFRLWAWEQMYSWNNNTDNQKRYFAQAAWQRTGDGSSNPNANDGKPKFDLSKFDQTYFDRIRSRVMEAGNRGMYVAVMLFDGWDLANAFNGTNGGLPYDSGNNLQGIAVGGTAVQDLSHSEVTAIQEAYVKKVIDTVNDLDNVLYEIANETQQSGVQWQYHMIDLIKQYEAGLAKQHPVGMTSTWPGSDDDLFASHADWISPNTKDMGGDGRKVVLNDTDHSYYWTALKSDGTDSQRSWVWRTFTAGAAAMFMDPYLEVWGGRNSPSGSTPDSYWEPLRNTMGYTRSYADRMDLEHALPAPSMCLTQHCLVNPGHEYLVYQPSSGSNFTVDVAAGSYHYEWFNPSTGSVAESGMMDLAAGSQGFSPPFSGDSVLYLWR